MNDDYPVNLISEACILFTTHDVLSFLFCSMSNLFHTQNGLVFHLLLVKHLIDSTTAKQCTMPATSVYARILCSRT